jgi:hypothetical protein
MKTGHLNVSRMCRVAAIAVVLVGVATPGFSQSGQQKTPPVRDYSPAPNKNGKKYVATREIIFDKASGTLRLPTTQETEDLVAHISSLTNRSTDGLTVAQQANGMKVMSLQGRFSGVVLGRALADGTTEVRCVMTLDEALEFLGLEESTSQQ